MIDLHALSSGGGTSLTNIGTIAAGGDGQTVAGLPLAVGAILVGWGGLTTIADTIKELKLNSSDLLDNQNAEDFLIGGAASGLKHVWDNLPYVIGQRTIGMSQNTGAANNLGYFMDYYPGGPVQGPSPQFGGGPPLNPFQGIQYLPQPLNWRGGVTSGALTAITWGATALAPSQAIPAGKYAILGAWVSSLTNYALIRFLHADFGAFTPGFPVVDVDQTIARANTPVDPLLLNPGYQFTWLSTFLQKPLEPIFTVGPGNTGLKVQLLDITADTPQVTLNLVKVA